MTILIFVLLLLAAGFGLEHWQQKHGLEDMESQLIPEDFLVEAEESVQIELILRNTGKLMKPFVGTRLHLKPEFVPDGETTPWFEKDQLGAGGTVQFKTWLWPHQEASCTVGVRLAKRGRYILEPLRVVCGDFLGLKEQVRQERGFHELIVPPKECEMPAVEAAVGGVLGSLSVNRYLYEDPILTAGYREYISGDPMHSISWKQSARGRGLMVKKFDYMTEPRVVVLVHADDADGQAEAVEICYSMARTACRMLEEKAIAYRFVVNTSFDLLMNAAFVDSNWNAPLEVPQGYGPEHFRRVLEMLGRACGQPARSCEVFFAKYLHPQEQQSLIVLTNTPDRVRGALPPLPGGEPLILTPEEGRQA